MQNIYFFTIAVSVLAVFMIYHELRRVNRKRLLLRVIAVLVASAALLFLIVPLKYETRLTTNVKQINYLTEGVEVCDLTDGIYFTSDSALLKTIRKGSITYIPDLLYHLASHPEISGVNVYGYGLPTTMLKRLEHLNIKFNAAQLPNGITACNWSQRLPASEVQRVQGRFNNTSKQAVKLVLEGLGTRLDSLMIPAGRHMTFSLSCTPRQTGYAIYQLHAFAGAEKIASEEIPFQVVEQPKPKILVLASSPDFEYKFLRNWLLEHKYPASFHTRISKDKFSTEQVNLQNSENTAITAASLRKYDLVIADDDELAALTTLKTSLAQEIGAGLGLLVRLNEANPLSSFTKGFKLLSKTDSITTVVQPVLSENNHKLKAVPISQPVFLASKTDQLKLVEDPKGQSLVSTTLRGKGRITATAIPSTFNWVLNASNADYSDYWSTLIKQTARRSSTDLYWNVEPRFPKVSEETKIVFQSSNTAMPEFKCVDRSLPVQQHLVLPFHWQASVRTNQKGWNDFIATGLDKQRLYVYDAAAWKAAKAAELLEHNKIFAEQQGKYTQKQEELVQMVENEVSKWVFFAVFLISAGFLWFETKILQ